MWSRTLLLMPLVAAAVALSGCVSISATSTFQPQSMGPLRLSVTGCAARSPGCPAAANGASIYGFLEGDPNNPTFPAQLLTAIRLPDGATPPDTFNAAINGGGTLAFTRSVSYEAELQAFEPAPAGERWWGWLSAQITYGARGPQSFSYTVEVPLPRTADGGPLPSPLHWRPVVGGRFVDTRNSLPASRAVDCGSSADDMYSGFSEDGSAQDTTDCVSSPGADGTRGFLDAPLIDFGLSGSTVQASAGATTTATFVARRSGPADPGTTFALAVSGGPPGAAIALDRASLSLASESTAVLATVTVPAGTAPGSYPITLTATAAGKPTRSAIATVVVPAPPAVPPGLPPIVPPGAPPVQPPPLSRDVVAPVMRASLTSKRFRAGARLVRATRGRAAVGSRLRVSLSEPARLEVSFTHVSRGRRSKGRCMARARRGASCTIAAPAGRLQAQSLRAGDTSIAVTGKVGRRTLASGSYRLTLVATDAAGNRSSPVTLTVTIVRS